MSNKIALPQSLAELGAAISPYRNEIVGGLAGGSLAGIGAYAAAPGKRTYETQDEYQRRRNSSALIAALGGTALGVGAGHFVVPAATKAVEKLMTPPPAPHVNTAGEDAIEGAGNMLQNPLVQSAGGAGAGFTVGKTLNAAAEKNSFNNYVARAEAYARGEHKGLVTIKDPQIDDLLTKFQGSKGTGVAGHNSPSQFVREMRAAGHESRVPRRLLTGNRTTAGLTAAGAAIAPFTLPILEQLKSLIFGKK